jgi:hypothetical protein
MEQAIVQAEQQAPIIEKDFDIDSFLAMREEFIKKVNAICVEGKDYHFIQGRKSLAKGGAEKIASIFGWTATFEKDKDVMEVVQGSAEGTIALICNLAKDGKFVGQGRGASSLKNNKGDANKWIKMAQKSAFIDAVIRASGLSDFFTQDLGPDDEGNQYNHLEGQNSQPGASSGSTGAIKPSQKQYDLIANLMEQKGITKEDLVAAGFVPGTLTGGKDGTASELINYLFKAKSKVLPNGDPVADFEDTASNSPYIS